MTSHDEERLIAEQKLFSADHLYIRKSEGETEQQRQGRKRHNKVQRLKDNECVICLQKLGYEVKADKDAWSNAPPSPHQQSGRRLTSFLRTPCKHAFHEQCLTKLMERYNMNCPICRQPLPQFHSM